MVRSFSASQRDLFKSCEWKWYQRYYKGLMPKHRFSVSRWFGIGIHYSLERWYIPGRERGIDPRESWKEYVSDSQEQFRFINIYEEGAFQEAIDAEDLGEDMLTGYLENYGDEPHLEVVSSEQRFEAELGHKKWKLSDGSAKSEDGTTPIVGYFDAVVRDHNVNQLFIFEHKTASAFGSGKTQFLPLDEQASMYFLVATKALRDQGHIGKNEKIDGIIYNYLIKRKRDTRPVNPQGFSCNKPLKKHYVEALDGIYDNVSKMTVKQLEKVAEEAGIVVFGDPSEKQPKKNFKRTKVFRSAKENKRQLERLKYDLERVSLIESGVFSPMKSPSNACAFCDFKDLCILDEVGRDTTMMETDLFTKKEAPSTSNLKKEIT